MFKHPKSTFHFKSRLLIFFEITITITFDYIINSLTHSNFWFLKTLLNEPGLILQLHLKHDKSPPLGEQTYSTYNN